MSTSNSTQGRKGAETQSKWETRSRVIAAYHLVELAQQLLQEPPVPAFSPEVCIAALREMRDELVAAEKAKDPSFVRWPDFDAMLDQIEKHGLPPCASASLRPCVKK